MKERVLLMLLKLHSRCFSTRPRTWGTSRIVLLELPGWGRPRQNS